LNQQLKICFYTEPRQITSIHIQQFHTETRRPTGKTLLHLCGEEIDRLMQCLILIRRVQFTDANHVKIDADALDQFDLTADAVKQFLLQHQELLQEIIEQDITNQDLVTLTYRKQQLQIFETC